jgi:hypothetical protein
MRKRVHSLKNKQMNRIGVWLGWWSGFAAFFLPLAGSMTWAEAAAGAVAAVLAAAAVLWGPPNGRKFAPKIAWLVKLKPIPGRAIRDCRTLAVALWRRVIRQEPLEGRLREVPFQSGREDARSAARRAVVMTALSVAPNNYVVDLDTRRDVLLVHRLVPDGPPAGRTSRR